MTLVGLVDRVSMGSDCEELVHGRTAGLPRNTFSLTKCMDTIDKDDCGGSKNGSTSKQESALG